MGEFTTDGSAFAVRGIRAEIDRSNHRKRGNEQKARRQILIEQPSLPANVTTEEWLAINREAYSMHACTSARVRAGASRRRNKPGSREAAKNAKGRSRCQRSKVQGFRGFGVQGFRGSAVPRFRGLAVPQFKSLRFSGSVSSASRVLPPLAFFSISCSFASRVSARRRRAAVRAACLFANACSQIRSTRQPVRWSSRFTLRSRLPRIFFRPNAALCFGHVACRGGGT